GGLPLNPLGLAGMEPWLAFNTAVSFVSNTNWQAYAGESALTNLTQMLGLTAQNFLSAATGLACLAALIRGLARRESALLGNFFVDLVRSLLYVLLPLALVLSLVLASQGVVQTLAARQEITPLQEAIQGAGLGPAKDGASGQALALGPAASQVAIKQLGTNGGGFFNANSAHPLENPTPLSNFLQCLAILLIPAALCHTFGAMVGDRRQGWVLFLAMLALFLAGLGLALWAEGAGNPRLAGLGLETGAGSLEGKEVRVGVTGSVLWAVATTAASNGSVNAMHDSLTPLGGLVPMLMMQLGEVVFGGVGSGLYGMLCFVLVAVFIAGLMVGRTPEYLGKKIGAFEIKMAALVIMAPLFAVLVPTALAVSGPAASAASNPGAHGFSQVLYAFSSMGNNNGSAFAGLDATGPLYTLGGAMAMLVARYWLALPVLALAGALAAAKSVPPGPGTLPTHTPLFCGLLVAVVLVVGALAFLPALALGPVVEHLQMLGH
ncbi:MAG: potassium-transporting ATPase subunit KdpA, partial [Desulfarculus sp.]|nr:potassium-transporting ATPase subunit KdpA [Desulfarculus sp.]